MNVSVTQDITPKNFPYEGLVAPISGQRLQLEIAGAPHCTRRVSDGSMSLLISFALWKISFAFAMPQKAINRINPAASAFRCPYLLHRRTFRHLDPLLPLPRH